jgi:hypothetical protein
MSNKQLAENIKSLMELVRCSTRTNDGPTWIFYEGRFYHSDRPEDVKMFQEALKKRVT